jgi:hypothetical protein
MPYAEVEQDIVPDILATEGKRRIRDKAVMDLPEPDSPTIPMASPACISKEMLSTAGFPEKLTVKFSTESRFRSGWLKKYAYLIFPKIAFSMRNHQCVNK